jgi:hypothetical protein
MFHTEELVHGIPSDAVRISGVYLDFAFHSKRLESMKDDIADLLDELPEAFHRRNGLGAPMLDGTTDVFDGRQLDCLLALGAAVGMVVMSSGKTTSQYITVCVDTSPHAYEGVVLH